SNVALFFFQAEDGIRDFHVTGVQTCALPIFETRLLFARFMSDARDEPPDIDVDFEHERREEVIQYIYEKYTRDRAAIVATVTHVRARGAARDVGKAMGLSLDAVGRLAGTVSSHWDNYIDEQLLAEQGFNPRDPTLRKV